MQRREHGFTLIEVLVALLILSVLAATAWKGIDAISTARIVSEENLQRSLRVQAVMTQWEADTGEVIDTYVVPAFQFDGANVRLTRRTTGGVQVVVWTVRERILLRWASPVTTRVGELSDYWRRSQFVQGRERGTLVALLGVDQMQLYCFRDGAMTNCQSSGDTARVAAPSAQPGSDPASAPGGALQMMAMREQLPDAVRVQLALGEDSGTAGTIQRDLWLAPQFNLSN